MLKIFPYPQCIFLPQTLNSDQLLLASVATLVVSKLLLVILLTQFQAGAFVLGKCILRHDSGKNAKSHRWDVCIQLWFVFSNQ